MLTGVNRALDAGVDAVPAERRVLGRPRLPPPLRRQQLRAAQLHRGERRARLAGSDRGAAAQQRARASSGPTTTSRYDPTRTSLRGDAQRVSFSKFGGGVTRFQSVYQRFSPGFETNDIGYQQRADEQLFRNWFALQFNKPTSCYRKAFFNFNAHERWTTEGLVLGNGLNHNLHIQLPSQWWVHFGCQRERPDPRVRRSRRARRAGDPPLEERERDGRDSRATDRKQVSTAFFGSAWKGDDGQLLVGRWWTEREPPRLQPLLGVAELRTTAATSTTGSSTRATATSAATPRTTPSRGSTRRRSASARGSTSPPRRICRSSSTGSRTSRTGRTPTGASSISRARRTTTSGSSSMARRAASSTASTTASSARTR